MHAPPSPKEIDLYIATERLSFDIESTSLPQGDRDVFQGLNGRDFYYVCSRNKIENDDLVKTKIYFLNCFREEMQWNNQEVGGDKADLERETRKNQGLPSRALINFSVKGRR